MSNAAISSVVITGRRMHSSGRFMRRYSVFCWAGLAWTRAPGVNLSWPSVTTVSPRGDALANRCQATIAGLHLDLPGLDGVVRPDDKQEVALRPLLYGF
ncbi:MAG: hypothetical protein V5B38_21625, partial [Candidatus Accumulibacter propinquus]